MKHFGELNEATLQDGNLQHIFGGAEAGSRIVSILQNKRLNASGRGVHDPILTDSGPLVQVVFGQAVMPLSRGR